MPETLPLPYVPTEATDIISFDGQRQGAAVIRYDVPLPGRHTGQRIVRIDLGLTDADFNGSYVSGLTESIQALEWKKAANSPNWTYNADKALDLYVARLQDVSSSFTYFPPLHNQMIYRSTPRNADGTLAPLAPIDDD